MTDTARATVPGSNLGLQNPRDSVTEPQIGMTYMARHSRVGPYWPLALIATVPLTNSVSPTNFISGQPLGAIHRAAPDKNSLGDFVATAGFGKQLIDQKTVAGAIPQTMVGIDDLQLWFDDVLVLLCEPGRIGIVMRVGWGIDRCARVCGRGVLADSGAG